MRSPARSILPALLVALAATAVAPPPAAAAGGEGFLYGKITTRDGKAYQGRLRWDDEEAFWGDFFNSSKEENRWVDEAPRRERRQRRTVELFGFELASIEGWDDEGSRQFVTRFGDIARLEPGHGDEVTVTLKSGTRFELEGGSNDVDAKITVWDDGFGEVGIDWRHIRSIELLPAPPSLAVAEPRLYGTVKTRSGDFTGYVQWDQEECLGNDELDGETDGGDDMSIRMGQIRSIARRSRSSSTVTLKDGRTVVLSDTNDVDSSNRGIYVEDPRFGRVLIGWDAFERVDFSDGGSGPAYSAFAPGQPLAAIVTVADGRKLSGRLVYDLDESETTEMLDGERRDIEYSIPFALVQTIVPGLDSARVTLRSGEQLHLEDTTDVGDGNAGLLLYELGKSKPVYVPWEDVEIIELAAPKRG